MANKNFEVKHGLSVGGTERITAAGAGSLTNLTLSGNLTVQGTTVTLDASTLQVADKNIVLNYHASNDTSSASSGAGITIQDAVNGTTDATILWDASDDEFDFSHAINIPNLKVSGAQGTDGQLLTSTGSGVAWEDAPASGPTFKTFGTDSIMIGDATTGTINAADYNTGLGVNVFANLTTGDKNTAVGYYTMGGRSSGSMTGGDNTAIGYEALPRVTSGQHNTSVGAYSGTYLSTGAGNTYIGYYAGYQNFTGSFNSVMGRAAFFYGDGSHNVAIGRRTLQNNGTKEYNTALGNYALSMVTTGGHNTGLGYEAGRQITTGSKNVIIGSYDGNENSLDIRTSSNNIVLSDGDANIRMRIDSSGNVGIGTTSPSQKLDVAGNLKLSDGYIEFDKSSVKGFRILQNDAGNDLSFQQGDTNNANYVTKLNISSSGYVGIGTTAPQKQLHIIGPDGTTSLTEGNSRTALFIDNAGATYVNLASSNSANAAIFFSDADANNRGALLYKHASDSLAFTTAAVERMNIYNNGLTTIDASSGSSIGNLRVKGTSGHSYIGVSRAAASQGEVGYTWNNNTSNIWWNYISASSSILNWYSTTGTKMTLNNSSGDLNVTAGNVVMSNGKGIDFSATSGSGTSELLDDYEEGSWSPALGNITTNSISVYGIYTKIGNLVHIHAKITATVASLPGATWKITGLPFSATSSSDTGQREIITIGGDCANLGGYANGRAHFRTDGSELQGVYLNSGSTAYWTYNTMDHTSFELHLSGTYRV